MTEDNTPKQTPEGSPPSGEDRLDSPVRRKMLVKAAYTAPTLFVLEISQKAHAVSGGPPGPPPFGQQQRRPSR
jgi:hypothetical protein